MAECWVLTVLHTYPEYEASKADPGPNRLSDEADEASSLVSPKGIHWTYLVMNISAHRAAKGRAK